MNPNCPCGEKIEPGLTLCPFCVTVVNLRTLADLTAMQRAFSKEGIRERRQT